MTSGRERFLLALTVIGFVVPNVMLGFYFADEGVTVAGFFEDTVTTLPATQIAVDIALVCVAFLAWASWDGPRSGVRRWWLAIPATFFVGLCFGAPLYLLMRERAIAARLPR